MKSIFVFGALFSLPLNIICCINGGSKLLLIVVGGGRWDYPEEDPGYTGFIRLTGNGVKAPYMDPVMPSVPYPNWYTLVTGLYPENHGFIHNFMYDSQHGEFMRSDAQSPSSSKHWWNWAEPLWITAEKNERRSALFYWNGCDVEIRGEKPSFCRKFNTEKPSARDALQHAFEAIMQLFRNGEIELAQVYYRFVDVEGRTRGPNSPSRRQAMKELDSMLNDIQTELIDNYMDTKVNIMVVSDGGMTPTDASTNLTVIDLELAIDPRDIKYMMYYGAGSMIYPENDKLQKLYDELKQFNGLHVYKKEDIPGHFHLKDSRLTPPLFLVAKPGYVIQGLDIPGKSIEMGKGFPLGSKGYDPLEMPDMRGFFFARGPCFRRGFISYALAMPDVYNVMCNVLGIQPLPNNGTKWKTNPMMRYHTKTK